MFIYHYSVMPNQMSITTSNISAINKQISNIQEQLKDHQINQSNLSSNIEFYVQYVASIYQMKANRFLRDNFKLNRGYYDFRVHNALLKSSDTQHKWSWNLDNFVKIAKYIFYELKYIHNFSDKQISTSKFVNVTARPKTSSSSKSGHHKENNHDNQHHNTSQPLLSHLNLQDIHNVHIKSMLHLNKLDYQVNNSIYKPFPYVRNYRSQLRPMWSPFHPQFYFFTAQVKYFSLNSSHMGLPTVVLSNIKHNGQRVTSHCHVFGSDVVTTLINKRIEQGSKISFFAQVCRYVKYDGAHNYLDFSLQNLKDLHLTSHKYPTLPSDRTHLIKAIQECIPTSQLHFILADYLNRIQNNTKDIESRIRPLHAQLVRLTNLKQMLNNQKQAVFENIGSSVLVIKANSTSTTDKRLRLVALLWCKQFNPVLATQYHIKFGVISGLSRRLTAYADRCQIDHTVDKDEHYHKVYALVKDIYQKYCSSINQAHQLCKSNHKLTTRQISQRCHLPISVIYKIRSHQ